MKTSRGIIIFLLAVVPQMSQNSSCTNTIYDCSNCYNFQILGFSINWRSYRNLWTKHEKIYTGQLPTIRKPDFVLYLIILRRSRVVGPTFLIAKPIKAQIEIVCQSGSVVSCVLWVWSSPCPLCQWKQAFHIFSFSYAYNTMAAK